MIVSYGLFDEFEKVDVKPLFFESLILKHGCKRILEVGSGAHPMLSPEFVRDNGLSYTTSDVSSEELLKADSAFEQLVIDISNDIAPELIGSFDCVLSLMVSEHIRDGRKYYGNIYKLLKPGGIAAQCFPTLWSLPFAANKLLPDALTDRLLNTFDPRERIQDNKFKAFYSWSRGPSPKMVRRFQSLGFVVLRYSGYFGHRYYRKRLPWLHWLDQKKSLFLSQHPMPLLCSYATLILQKPRNAKET